MSSLYGPSTVIPIYATFTGVAIGLTGLRLWVRRTTSRTPLGLDDLFVVLGLLVTCGCVGMQFYNAIAGSGGEAITSKMAAQQAGIRSRKIDWAMIVIEKPAFGFIKLSFLFFYRRIFGIWASFRRVNNICIAIVALWTFSFVLGDVFLCGAHPELNWAVDQTVSLHSCGNKGAILLAFSVTSVVTDAIVLCLPFFYIGRLQMPKAKKLGASLVFFLGFASTGASILRLIFLSITYPLGRLNFGYVAPPGEQTSLVLRVFNPTFWVMVEMLLALWAANLPPCAPALVTSSGFGRVLGSWYRTLSSWASSSSSALADRTTSTIWTIGGGRRGSDHHHHQDEKKRKDSGGGKGNKRSQQQKHAGPGRSDLDLAALADHHELLRGSTSRDSASGRDGGGGISPGGVSPGGSGERTVATRIV